MNGMGGCLLFLLPVLGFAIGITIGLFRAALFDSNIEILISVLVGTGIGFLTGVGFYLLEWYEDRADEKRLAPVRRYHKELYPKIQRVLRRDSKVSVAPIKDAQLIKYRLYYDEVREEIYLVINREWTGDKNLYVYNAIEGDFNLLAEENDLVTGVTNLMFISQGTEYGVKVFNDMNRVILNNSDKIGGNITKWLVTYVDVYFE